MDLTRRTTRTQSTARRLSLHGNARAALEEEQKRLDREVEALRQSVKTKSSALCELDPSIAGGSNVHRSFVSLHGVSAGELEGLLK